MLKVSHVHFLDLINIRYSLAGQDTGPSPERPGFESRWRNLSFYMLMWRVVRELVREESQD